MYVHKIHHIILLGLTHSSYMFQFLILALRP